MCSRAPGQPEVWQGCRGVPSGLGADGSEAHWSLMWSLGGTLKGEWIFQADKE